MLKTVAFIILAGASLAAMAPSHPEARDKQRAQIRASVRPHVTVEMTDKGVAIKSNTGKPLVYRREGRLIIVAAD